MDPRLYLKAIAGGLTAGLGVLFLALADNVVTGQEWVGVAQAALVTVCAVYQIPNAGSVMVLDGPSYVPGKQPVKSVTDLVPGATTPAADPNSR